MRREREREREKEREREVTPVSVHEKHCKNYVKYKPRIAYI